MRFKKYFKRLGICLLFVVVIMSVIYGLVARTPGEPAAARQFFLESAGRPLVIAHRGGGGAAPENTLDAFKRAIEAGADVIEIDVRATADGELIVLHDAAVDRTTSGAGRVGEMSAVQLRKLDAGYKWTPDGGATYPLRAKNITVPTLREVFDAFPSMRFNIEPKQETPSIIIPLCRLVRERKMTDKIVVGSFTQAIIDAFRRECPEVATAAAPFEVSKFLALYKAGLSKNYAPPMQALQIPDFGGVTGEFVEAAHERNLQVHVWTINETADMKRLLDAGVDGIMTDYPDRLLTVLKQPPAE